MIAGKGAARAGDHHDCPHGSHVGGPILAGSDNVWIDDKPAARMGDRSRCCGPTDRIESSAPGVFFNWRRAARQGDATRHSGVVVGGSSGVYIGDLGLSGDPRARPDSERIESDFALRRLRGVAMKLPWGDFAKWAGSVYGFDLHFSAYQGLHASLREGSFPNAEIVVDDLEGHLIEYDGYTHKIRVSRGLARDAAANRHAAWKLMFGLVGEFGHHVDHELRTRFAPAAEVEPDAPLDEGDAFAFALIDFRFAHRDRLQYGTYHRRRGGAVALEVSWRELREAVNELDRDAMILDDGREGEIEFFDAKEHHEIEMALAAPEYHPGRAPPFTADEADKVYFGNWLSDYSQAVSPFMLTRLPWALNYIKDRAADIVRCSAKKLGVNAPSGPGDIDAAAARVIMTRLVGVLAVSEFTKVYRTAGRAGWFDVKMPKAFEVRGETLGVYEPRHHVDNPKTEGDNSHLDKDFRSAWTEADGEINKDTWMKRYFADSAAYMKAMLERAANERDTDEGLVHLGRVLHVIEDFYAHSNFIEIVLAEKRDGRVKTWTRAMKSGEGSTKHRPIVTGIFGSDDMVASLLAKVVRMLDPEKKTENAQISEGDGIVIGVMLDLQLHVTEDHRWLARALGLLRVAYGGTSWVADKITRAMKAIGEVIEAIDLDEYLARKTLRAALQRAFAWLLKEQIEATRKAQQMYAGAGVGESTDPTHSQIAKDMPSHPLHSLAVECARWATADVGRALQDLWTVERSGGVGDRAALVATALRYLAHPFREGPGVNPAVDAQVARITAWGRDVTHAAAVERACREPGENDHAADTLMELERMIGAQVRQRLDAQDRSAGAAIGGCEASPGSLEPTEAAVDDYFNWMRGLTNPDAPRAPAPE
jgi:uncharacterized Zn-binding protein involved in type VI secretion